MRPAQLGHRHPTFSLTQDRKDLRLSVSACLHSESPHASCRENSTYAAPYFRGGLPDDLFASLGPAYSAGAALIRSFQSAPGIDYRPDTTVWDLRADGTVGWLRAGNAGYIRARHVLLATGAMERPVPFPGWTLPGVMTAGAVQTLIKAGRLQPEGQIVLAGTGLLIFLLADQLRRIGVKPVLIARTDRLRDKLTAWPYLRLRALPQVLKGLGWLAQPPLRAQLKHPHHQSRLRRMAQCLR